MAPSSLKQTDRTRLRRLPARGSFDRQQIYRILDEGFVCHLGFQIDGSPFVLPTGYARRGDTLLIHGSAASRTLRHLAAGAEVCVTVTLLDALVLARSGFHHSMNYRSVMLFGHATPIRDPELKRAALDALVEHLVPGRTRDARRPNERELDATEVLALPIEEGSAKIRTGPPIDDDADVSLRVWAGVIPLRLTPLEPIAAPDLDRTIAVPSYVSGYRRPGT